MCNIFKAKWDYGHLFVDRMSRPDQSNWINTKRKLFKSRLSIFSNLNINAIKYLMGNKSIITTYVIKICAYLFTDGQNKETLFGFWLESTNVTNIQSISSVSHLDSSQPTPPLLDQWEALKTCRSQSESSSEGGRMSCGAYAGVV